MRNRRLLFIGDSYVRTLLEVVLRMSDLNIGHLGKLRDLAPWTFPELGLNVTYWPVGLGTDPAPPELANLDASNRFDVAFVSIGAWSADAELLDKARWQERVTMLLGFARRVARHAMWAPTMPWSYALHNRIRTDPRLDLVNCWSALAVTKLGVPVLDIYPLAAARKFEKWEG